MDAQSTRVADAQRDMRESYLGGIPGVLVSAAVWFTAGVVALLVSEANAVWTLLVGGMLIHPGAVLVTKLCGRSGQHSVGNPLSSLALATTFWLIVSLPLAYAASLVRVEWFFPAMLVIIGGRYTTFAPLYGERSYWILGTCLVLASVGLVVVHAGAAAAAFTGAAIEGVGGAVLLAAGRVPEPGTARSHPTYGQTVVPNKGAEVDAGRCMFSGSERVRRLE